MTQGQLETRLESLRQEFEKGQSQLAEVQSRESELQRQLLRIGGAIQVIEELLESTQPDTEDDPAS